MSALMIFHTLCRSHFAYHVLVFRRELLKLPLVLLPDLADGDDTGGEVEEAPRDVRERGHGQVAVSALRRNFQFLLVKESLSRDTKVEVTLSGAGMLAAGTMTASMLAPLRSLMNLLRMRSRLYRPAMTSRLR